MAPPLLTVGHGTLSQRALADLLRSAGVGVLLDVRRYPGSRAHPHVGRDALQQWLPAAGMRYRWDERLGGRRKTPADSRDGWWQVDGFRAYAAHMRTPEFAAAVAEVLADVAATTAAVMCAETVWWRCHRRLVADYCSLIHGVPVEHLSHDGRRSAHRPAEGARVVDGLLVYDAQ